MNFSPRNPTFMEKAGQGVEGYKKAGRKAVEKSKEWRRAAGQGLDDSAAAYNNQLAKNKAKVQAKEQIDNIKSAFGAQGGSRRRRRRRRRTRRRRKRGGRKRSRRRRRTRRRKKRTKRRTRRRRVRGGSCPSSVSEIKTQADKNAFYSRKCVSKRTGKYLKSQANLKDKRRTFARRHDTRWKQYTRPRSQWTGKASDVLQAKSVAQTRDFLKNRDARRKQIAFSSPKMEDLYLRNFSKDPFVQRRLRERDDRVEIKY